MKSQWCMQRLPATSAELPGMQKLSRPKRFHPSSGFVCDQRVLRFSTEVEKGASSG